jgi:hypothetical protein
MAYNISTMLNASSANGHEDLLKTIDRYDAIIQAD